MARIHMGQNALRGIVFGLIGILVGGLASPYIADAATIELVACKKLAAEQNYLQTAECGGTFTTKDAYVGLVIHLQQIFDRTPVEAELLDPDQTLVWSRTITITIPVAGDVRGYRDYWLTAVLPLDDAASAVRSNPRFLFSIITPKDKPFRERLGEWTFRVSINGGGAVVLKFGLQAPSE